MEDQSIVYPHPPRQLPAAASNETDLAAQPPFRPELGLTEETRPVFQDWLDRLCAESSTLKTFQRHRVRRFVLALDDTNLIADAFRRLNLILNSAEEVTHWLSLTGVSALDVVETSILSRPDYMHRHTAEMVRAFAKAAESPEAVSCLFRISRRTELAQPTLEWLETHPRETIAGLVALVANHDPLSTEASRFLHILKTKGHEEALNEVLKQASPDVARAIFETELPNSDVTVPFDDETTPDWLGQGLVYGTWNGKIPAETIPAGLPKISIGGNHFNESQVRDFLTMLSNVLSPNLKKTPHGPFFERLVQIIGQRKWEEFLWAVLDGWKQMGLKESPQGPVFSLGFWGDDFTAQELNKNLMKWRQDVTPVLHQAAHAALRSIGTPTALSFLKEFAYLPLSLSISRREAWSVYCSIAEEKGIPRHELHELDLQIIPDCGFNQKVTGSFDFGPRKIYVSTGFDLRPVISNEFGKIKKRFPKPGRKDDRRRVELALREWGLFKEQLRLIREIHLSQFEAAMKNRLTWKVDSFIRHLIGNPAVIEFCRRIVWGTYTGNGKYLKSFRVCEDNTFSDLMDRRFILPADCRIGIVLPSQMTYGEHNDWLGIFNEHFLTQPFPQLELPDAWREKQNLKGR